MADECVVGVHENAAKAEAAVRQLDESEFPTSQVSLVKASFDFDPKLLEELQWGDDALRDAAIGAGLGGVIGVLAGTSVAGLAGFGPIFFVGPLSAMVGGSLTGAFFGTIAGCGVHNHGAEHYEQLVKENKVLVVAHGDPLKLVDAENALRASDFLELHVLAKTGDDAGKCRAH